MIGPSRQFSSIESPVGIKALTISTMSARTTSVQLIDSKVLKVGCGRGVFGSMSCTLKDVSLRSKSLL